VSGCAVRSCNFRCCRLLVLTRSASSVQVPGQHPDAQPAAEDTDIHRGGTIHCQRCWCTEFRWHSGTQSSPSAGQFKAVPREQLVPVGAVETEAAELQLKARPVLLCWFLLWSSLSQLCAEPYGTGADWPTLQHQADGLGGCFCFHAGVHPCARQQHACRAVQQPQPRRTGVTLLG
jgi:hypothetical protein